MAKPINLAEKRREKMEQYLYRTLADKLAIAIGDWIMGSVDENQFRELVLTVQRWLANSYQAGYEAGYKAGEKRERHEV
jgi:hypothetical protein